MLGGIFSTGIVAVFFRFACFFLSLSVDLDRRRKKEARQKFSAGMKCKASGLGILGKRENRGCQNEGTQDQRDFFSQRVHHREAFQSRAWYHYSRSGVNRKARRY